MDLRACCVTAHAWNEHLAEWRWTFWSVCRWRFLWVTWSTPFTRWKGQWSSLSAETAEWSRSYTAQRYIPPLLFQTSAGKSLTCPGTRLYPTCPTARSLSRLRGRGFDPELTSLARPSRVRPGFLRVFPVSSQVDLATLKWPLDMKGAFALGEDKTFVLQRFSI